MEAVINGKSRSLPDAFTLADLLAESGLRPEMVVVERNSVIEERTALAQTRIAPGDQIEIVHFVGGG